MSRKERAFVIVTLMFAAVIFPVFVLAIYLTFDAQPILRAAVFSVVVPLHVLGIGLCFGVIYLAIRDLFKRDFADKTLSRVLWLSVIFGTGGWGAFFYAFRHGFKPRHL